MKKSICILLLFMVAVMTMKSQQKKALIGGDFGAMFLKNTSNYSPESEHLAARYGSNSTDYQSLILQTSPSISFFVTDRLLLGAGIEFLSDTKKFDRDMIRKEKVSSTLIYPMIRYYIHGGLYGQARLNYGKSRLKTTSDSQPLPGSSGYTSVDYTREAAATTYGFGISPGYSFLLGERIMADLAVNYLMHFNKAKYESAGMTQEISYRHRQNIFYLSVGFKYLIVK